MHVEMTFPVLGRELPLDHGFALFGALSRLLPKLHEPEFPAAVGPISGEAAGNGKMLLAPLRPIPRKKPETVEIHGAERMRHPPQPKLRIRLPADAVGTFMPLAGQTLAVGDCRIRCGVPSLFPLSPAPALASRIVITRNGDDSERFLSEVTRQLSEMGLPNVKPKIPPVFTGPHAGKPTRRVMRIHAKVVVGWSLVVEGLTAEESLLLQERGLGGRRKMGAGWFAPVSSSGGET